MCGFQIRFTFYEYKCINDQILWSFKDSANKEHHRLQHLHSFLMDKIFSGLLEQVCKIYPSDEDLQFADLLMIIYELLKTIKIQLTIL